MVSFDLRGIDEEPRHGSVHGAARVASYGAAVFTERLTATTSDGVSLAVFGAGEGEPLLLIPGLGAGSSVFEPVVDRLARRHRVISFDARGIGESGNGGEITLPNMARDAVAVLD